MTNIRFGIDIDGTVTSPTSLLPHINEAFKCNLQLEDIKEYDLTKAFPVSQKEFYEWFKKAADEGGLAKAQFKIGKMLYFGEGVKKNIAQGVNYVKLAFNNGYPTAMQFWNENQLWRYEQ